jgi:hypothetical protein
MIHAHKYTGDEDLGLKLIYAITLEDIAGARMLVSRGASLDYKVSNDLTIWWDGSIWLMRGVTSVIYCCAHGYSKILQFLLEQGAKAELAGRDGMLPIHFAAKCNSMECITVLLAHGAAVDAITPNGITSLLVASVLGNLSVVQLLVRAGADIEVAFYKGVTSLKGVRPCDAARKERHHEVVRYLDTEIKWRRRRAWATVFDSIKNVDSNAGIFRVMQNRDLAGVIASYL